MTTAPVHHRLITEEGVYGVILVSGMIVVSGTTASVVWEVFVSVVATVMVFWAAHVYAGTVASYRVGAGHPGSMPDALRSALLRSSGLLVGAALPTGVLLLGAARVIPDVLAVWVSLWVGVAVLAVIGYIVFRDRGSSVTTSLLGSIGTAAFGLVMIALKVALH